MRVSKRFMIVLAVAGTCIISTPVLADKSVRCESQNNQYKMCRVDTHGYVRLEKQLSNSECRQGRSWDYDRRGIWVDDGCRAEFVVESRHHTDDHEDHNGAAAAAAIAAVAMIAVAAAASSDNDSDDVPETRYQDDRYHHGGHSSISRTGWWVSSRAITPSTVPK